MMIGPDDFGHWERALQGEPFVPPAYKVVPGFYRMQSRDGQIGVAVYPENEEGGDPVVQRGKRDPYVLRTKEQEEDFCGDYFLRCKPVTEDAYFAWFETGQWPDDVAMPTRNAQAAQEVQIAEAIEEIERDLKRWLEGIGGEIKTQEQADKAASFRNRVHTLAQEAEQKRKAEKEPHLRAGQAVDDKWRGVKDAGDTLRKRIEDYVRPFLTEQMRAKAAAAAEAAKEGKVVKPEDLKVAAGKTGRTIGLRTEKVLRFSDKNETEAHYADDDRLWADPRVYAVMAGLARADLIAGKKVPGAYLEDEGKAR